MRTTAVLTMNAHRSSRIWAVRPRKPTRPLEEETSMYWLKGCKKCGGDLFLEKDKFGSYVSCLQCGAVRLDFDDNTQTVAVGTLLEGQRKNQSPA